MLIDDATLTALLLYIPAFLSNGAPVLINGSHPIDFGRRFPDGRRILGDGKTFEGLFSGLTVSLYVGYTISAISGSLSYVIPCFLSGTGSLLGDAAAAFIKRRLGIPRGSPAPLLDQTDFVLGSTLILHVAGYTPTIEAFAIALGASLILHVVTNRVAYHFGLKDVPW